MFSVLFLLIAFPVVRRSGNIATDFTQFFFSRRTA